MDNPTVVPAATIAAVAILFGTKRRAFDRIGCGEVAVFVNERRNGFRHRHSKLGVRSNGGDTLPHQRLLILLRRRFPSPPIKGTTKKISLKVVLIIGIMGGGGGGGGHRSVEVVGREVEEEPGGGVVRVCRIGRGV